MSSQIKFKRSLFGISKKPVVEYIESISKNIDDKLFKKDAEIAQLKKDIEILNMEKNALKKEISDFEEEKKKISDVFLKAEETARNTIEKANKEASEMLKKAQEDINLSFEKMRQDQQKESIEFDAKISEKRNELNNYKNEITYLREKIKVTLNKFDEILANSIK